MTIKDKNGNNNNNKQSIIFNDNNIKCIGNSDCTKEWKRIKNSNFKKDQCNIKEEDEGMSKTTKIIIIVVDVVILLLIIGGGILICWKCYPGDEKKEKKSNIENAEINNDKSQQKSGMKMNDARGIKRCRWIQKQRHEGFNVFVPLFRINAFISDESEY